MGDDHHHDPPVGPPPTHLNPLFTRVSDRTADQIFADALTPQGRNPIGFPYAELTWAGRPGPAGDPATHRTKQPLDWRDCYVGGSFEGLLIVGRMPSS
jgi:hypothetical protein